MDIISIGEYTYFVEIEWKQIKVNGIETKYDVNNIGQVRNRETGRILSSYIDKDGYIHSSIIVNGHQYHPGVHRFVATAFIPNPENKPEVNHMNGAKYDNTVYNLEWCTSSENVKHAFKNGFKHSILGQDNVLSKYTEKQIRKVCELLETGMSNIIISNITGVDRKYITDIKKGRRWKHISIQYKIPKDKYPKELRMKIHILIKDGKSNSMIIKELLLDDNDSVRSLIDRCRRKYRSESSTTIEKTPNCVTE